MHFFDRSAPWLAVSAAFALTGCATLTADRGFDPVSRTVEARIGVAPRWAASDDDRTAIRGEVESLLAKPLSADDAVRIALLNSPSLQAVYAEVGIGQAELVQASRLRNPGFTFERTRSGDEKKIERTFTFELVNLAMLPLITRMEGYRFESTRQRVAGEIMASAAEVRRAYYSAVAAGQAVGYLEQAVEAAEASAELAQRMARAGNYSRLAETREELFYAETIAQLARARQTAVGERERLARLLGLWGADTQFTLPERLPDLPQAARSLENAEATAIAQRLDIQAAKQDAEALAEALGLTRVTRFVNVLEVGYKRNSETGKARETGYEISLELPIFDWGEARVARAELIYLQALDRASAAAINARSEVREAYHAYRTAYDLGRHYRDAILPLRKRISDENLLRYNGMLIGVFELLADARAQVTTVTAYISALRDYWLAESNLQAALVGRGASAMSFASGEAVPAVGGGGH